MHIFYNASEDIWKPYACKLFRKITKDIIMLTEEETPTLTLPCLSFKDCIIDDGRDFFERKVDVEKAKQEFLNLVSQNEDVVFLTSLKWSDIHIRYKNGFKYLCDISTLYQWLKKNRNAKIHLFVQIDSDTKDDNYTRYLPYLKGLEHCDSVAFINTNGVIAKNEGLYDSYEDKTDNEIASAVLCNKAIDILPKTMNLAGHDTNQIYIFNNDRNRYYIYDCSEKYKYPKRGYWNNFEKKLIPDKLKLCARLKELQAEIAKKYNQDFEVCKCREADSCDGNCYDMEMKRLDLCNLIQECNTDFNIVSGDSADVPFRGTYEFCENCCGKGMRSFLALNDCCLDFQKKAVETCKKDFPFCRDIVLWQMDAIVRETLYYHATGGGITFGFGEPLLYPDFIHDCYKSGINSVDVVTSLNVPLKSVMKVAKAVDEWFVDVLDMNTEIYKKITGKDNLFVYRNLLYLLKERHLDKIYVYLPLIEGYNTEEDVENSVRILKMMSVKNIIKGSKSDPLLISQAMLTNKFKYLK